MRCKLYLGRIHIVRISFKWVGWVRKIVLAGVQIKLFLSELGGELYRCGARKILQNKMPHQTMEILN